MVVLTPEEQFTKSLIIQTPTIKSGQGTFQNIVSVIYMTVAAQHTFFDVVKIAPFNPKYMSTKRPIIVKKNTQIPA